jgi:hypothetical protein
MTASDIQLAKILLQELINNDANLGAAIKTGG